MGNYVETAYAIVTTIIGARRRYPAKKGGKAKCEGIARNILREAYTGIIPGEFSVFTKVMLMEFSWLRESADQAAEFPLSRPGTNAFASKTRAGG